ncbi:phospho-N-acetylmuramoyl-pentapeptide-transferase [Candidatus Liberibacter americanus]|uniref:Phospho-N-acetylmuramoyl-pentapeptide-transferase n=1 Tax=Candidatus Liberibacter americanus str. Sao Paulo TaxID=1261131 RepID=U6B5C5_9HYPH|nr:phospho-N-acetylmuramoyl-pentapeptide-transferase [Candidatus Liberibacter americanus]AHA27833.1 UDP-N-acetylmuramyl pentapeptide phosphotransferase/UDP-N- acetylglucosamine-1-phosphate transferase [Candidatus Liberibacter americanus str. Sao Paulo]EMS36000.1 phospho-N-acetylmuramoyl-pentapeptide-transferase [Candidatus Liberibacter americanus PW_SP]
MFAGLADFSEYILLLNLFKYITFRSIAAFLSSSFMILAFGDKMISLLRAYQGDKGQPIRIDNLPIHSKKIGTPTMGGLMILFGIITSSLLWADFSSPHVIIVLFLAFGFGIVGFCDDYLKIISKNHRGLSWYIRIIIEIIIATIAMCAFLFFSKSKLLGIDTTTAISFPFMKNFILDIGIFFIPFGAIVIVAVANAVNLTDGLDGLAIVPIMIASVAFALIAYASGNVIFAHYLQINFVPGVGELAVIVGALIGSGLGFLWFNAPPAAIFMGDTGSLALGALLGGIAVATKHEIIMIIIGGVFVVETLSVIVQVLYFKIIGKRILLMAPIHHHFEKKGWSESQIVIRFWIISFILAVVGLLTLKIR